MITETGAIISSNGRSKISVEEVIDYSMMPEYPATSENGILHFIHCQNSMQGEGLATARDAATREMSKVCSAYAVHMHN